MDRILIILKKENGSRASSAPALGLNTIIFKYIYWYMKQISGERLQDHWSSGSMAVQPNLCSPWSETRKTFSFLVTAESGTIVLQLQEKSAYLTQIGRVDFSNNINWIRPF